MNRTMLFFMAVLHLLVWSTIFAIASSSDENVTRISIESERRQRVSTMLQVYLQQHSVDAVINQSKEELCQREFVTTIRYIGCESIGNSFATFLSNLVLAVVTNRTFVSYHINLSKCYGYLSLSPWITSMEALAPLLESAGCPIIEQAKYIDNQSYSPCGFFDDTSRLLSNDAYWQDLGLQASLNYDPNLSQFVQDRTNLLFGSPYDDYGRFESYGLLAAHSLVFSKDVHHSLSEILKLTHEIGNSIRISIHLRHKPTPGGLNDEVADKTIDAFVLDALKYLKNLHTDKLCYVYVAADRNESLMMVHDYATSIGCTPYSSEKTDSSHDQKKTKEHGPWAMGLAQLSDLLLLSHGDYFIGTWYSTYSHLAADLLAAHVFNKGGFYNPLVWVNSDTPEKVLSHMTGEFSSFFRVTKVPYDKWNCTAGKGMKLVDIVWN